MSEKRANVRRAMPRSYAAAVLAGLALLVAVSWEGNAPGQVGSTAAIDPALVAQLRSSGIGVHPLKSVAGAISSSAAVAAAGEVGSGDQRVPGVPTLVSLTDETHGGVPAWAVVFAGVDAPMIGPPEVAGGDYETDLVVLLDAITGEYLRAISFAATYRPTS